MADVLEPVGGELLSAAGPARTELLADHPQLAVAHSAVDAGAPTPPPHLHRNHAECFVVLDGTLVVRAGGIEVEAPAGTVAFVPRGSAHAFSVPTGVRFLDLHVPPAGFGSFVRALHAASDQAALDAARARWDQEPADLHGGSVVVVPFQGGETIADQPDRRVHLLVDDADVAITHTVYGPSRRGPDLHVHHLHTDAFLVLEGTMTFAIGEGTLHAGPGTFVAVPPDVVHAFRNGGPEPVRFLNVHAPGCAFGDHLRGTSLDFDQHDPPDSGTAAPAGAVAWTLRTF